jgi:hypothetical protein
VERIEGSAEGNGSIDHRKASRNDVFAADVALSMPSW